MPPRHRARKVSNWKFAKFTPQRAGAGARAVACWISTEGKLTKLTVLQGSNPMLRACLVVNFDLGAQDHESKQAQIRVCRTGVSLMSGLGGKRTLLPSLLARQV